MISRTFQPDVSGGHTEPHPSRPLRSASAKPVHGIIHQDNPL